MIKHVVMWHFKEENKEANMQKARELLLALPAMISEIKKMNVYFDALGKDAVITDIPDGDPRFAGDLAVQLAVDGAGCTGTTDPQIINDLTHFFLYTIINTLYAMRIYVRFFASPIQYTAFWVFQGGE